MYFSGLRRSDERDPGIVQNIESDILDDTALRAEGLVDTHLWEITSPSCFKTAIRSFGRKSIYET